MKLLKASAFLNCAALGYGLVNNYYLSRKKSRVLYTEEQFSTKFEEFRNNNENKKYFSEPIKRDEMISELEKKKYDLLIIGGGSAGAGVLLDAYSRGLTAALIETNDFASGTSSKSTKLAHGGIRYLEDAFKLKGNLKETFNLLFEALKERDFFLNSAPFMNKPIEIKIPANNLLDLNYYYLGVFVYHTLYFISSFPNLFYTFSGPKIYLADDNKKKSYKYSAAWYEGQFWDARQNVLSILSCRANYLKGR